MDSIYLDHNATTPIDPGVLDVMRPYWLAPLNPDSYHACGRKARQAWEGAQERVAQIVGADPTEVVFTSGGTEANNLALFGLASQASRACHIVTSLIEHSAVVEPLRRLETLGARVERIGVSGEGIADVRSMAASLEPQTRFATLILAHNETGALQPVRELVELAANQGVPVHTDAVQAVGRIPIHFQNLGVATLAASAHKFHGPTGVGFLLVRKGLTLTPQILGGHQQAGRRAGTPSLALAVGLAEALARWNSKASDQALRWITLRDRLELSLIRALGSDRVKRNGPSFPNHRLPQTLNLGFPGVPGELLLMRLDLAGLCISLGAACATGSTQPSPSLQAMRIPNAWLRSSVRFSFGVATTEEEIDEAVRRIVRVVNELSESPSELSSPEVQ